jgi:hypothetical protein
MAKIIDMNFDRNKLIKEITDQLDCGQNAFIHKYTKKTLFVPDTENNIYADDSFFEKELEELEKNFDSYFKIERMTSRESFEVMENFIAECDDNKTLQSKLVNALQKSKPFREFKFIIDYSGDYRNKWFDFKEKKYLLFVEKQLEELGFQAK